MLGLELLTTLLVRVAPPAVAVFPMLLESFNDLRGRQTMDHFAGMMEVCRH